MNNFIYLDDFELFNTIIKDRHTDIDLYKLTTGSNKIMWWLCNNGHEWKSKINNRFQKKRGCPFCSKTNKKVCLENCLATKTPELISEWSEKNTFTPYDITPKSNKKVWWKCKKNHEYQTSPHERNRNRNCPFCSGKKVCMDNCLLTLNPNLASEWNYEKNGNLTPKDLTQFSTKKVWWKCEKGHEWNALVSNRSSGAGCKKCNNPNISKIELKFFDKINKIFSKTNHSYSHYINDKSYEIDIFLPEYNIGFEIDGGYAHQRDKVKRTDFIKNELLSQSGIKLVRFRELGLHSTGVEEYYYVHRKDDSINSCISQALISLLKQIKFNYLDTQQINNFINSINGHKEHKT